jgi:hypothetical protein
MSWLQILYTPLIYITIFVRTIFLLCHAYFKVFKYYITSTPDFEKRVERLQRVADVVYNALFGFVLLYNFNPYYHSTDIIDSSTKSILFAYGVSSIASLFI